MNIALYTFALCLLFVGYRIERAIARSNEILAETKSGLDTSNATLAGIAGVLAGTEVTYTIDTGSGGEGDGWVN